jgi:hypothetical protein
MSQELIKNSMPASITESMSIAKMFAESGMFSDVKSAAQALVKIQAGAEMGIPPFASMSGVHIIQGKPTVGAGLMASRVKASGKYDYRVIEQTDKLCSIDFYQGKEKIGNSTFTLDDAKKAGTKNLDKFPKNMLFARAISNGVKWYCPDVFAGPVYVPEEMETIDVKAEVIQEAKPAETVKIPIPEPTMDELTNHMRRLLSSTPSEILAQDIKDAMWDTFDSLKDVQEAKQFVKQSYEKVKELKSKAVPVN